MSNEIVTQDFSQVASIINLHRMRALQEVNNNSLLIAWNVGGYISQKLKSAEWGDKVVAELSEYLRANDPSMKGYSRRTLYKMVQFYDAYSDSNFTAMLDRLKLSKYFNQLPENQADKIVPTLSAQFPEVLLCTNWSNHVQILSSCKSYEQKIFYMLYAKKEKLIPEAVLQRTLEEFVGFIDKAK